MKFAIRTENLGKRFGSTVALNGVGVEVPEGAIYALVGPNGAGKTTLIKLLINIFRPTAGSATVLGLDSRRVAAGVLCQIGYVSENQEAPDWMRVGEMLRYYRNFYPSWDRELETQLVRQFDLPLDRRLKHLPRGMRMKAAFASSLAYRPRLILLDEPLSGLDPLVRDELIEGLLDRAPETTVFLSSHDLAEIEGFSSHVGFSGKGWAAVPGGDGVTYSPFPRCDRNVQRAGNNTCSSAFFLAAGRGSGFGAALRAQQL